MDDPFVAAFGMNAMSPREVLNAMDIAFRHLNSARYQHRQAASPHCDCEVHRMNEALSRMIPAKEHLCVQLSVQPARVAAPGSE